MRQQTFARTGRTDYCHHFSCMDRDTQIFDHRQFCLLYSFLVLGKRYFHVVDFQNFFPFHSLLLFVCTCRIQQPAEIFTCCIKTYNGDHQHNSRK